MSLKQEKLVLDKFLNGISNKKYIISRDFVLNKRLTEIDSNSLFKQ